MFIVDAQVHIWAANSPDRPWFPGARPHLDTPFEAGDLVEDLDRAGVSRAVLVPPRVEGVRNDLALKAAADYPGRFGVMGVLDVRDPTSVDLSTWLDDPNMLGIRLVFSQPEPDEFGARASLSDGTAEWIFRQADEFHVPIMIWSPGLSAQIGDVARSHPNLRLIVDHLNLGTQLRDEQIGPELEKLLALSEIPNIAVKVSGLPSLVSEPYPFSSLHPHIRSVIDAFGVERCMWGSDRTRLPCAYGDWVRAITEGVDFLSDADKAQLMGGTLTQWLDWPE